MPLSMANPKSDIVPGSWVLVTGATGYVASHVTRELLQRGYKVRGTVRDIGQASWLVQDLFKEYADRGDLELVLVPDIAAEGAFSDAVKGMSAIAHIATVTTFDPNPHKVVAPTIAATTAVMEAALQEPNVQSFVYTSTILTATHIAVGNAEHVERDTWNDSVVKAAFAPPPYEASRGWLSYGASKVLAEQEVWKFAAERKPHFRVNTVNPSGIMGQPLHKKHTENSVAWVKQIWDGDRVALARYPAGYFVDVKDVALLHVAALLDPQVELARLQTWGHRANWNEMLKILRKLRPQRTFINDLPDSPEVSMTTDETEQFRLMKMWGGQGGWRTMEDTILDNISNPYFV